jgi:hypothetical protein
LFNVLILNLRSTEIQHSADSRLVARQKAKSRFHPRVEAAEAWASMEQSVHEQGDQDDDRDRYAEEKQQ